MNEHSIDDLQEKQAKLDEFLSALTDFITGLERTSDEEYQRFSDEFRRLKRVLSMDQLVEIDREAAEISRLERDLIPVIQEAVRGNFRLKFLRQVIDLLQDGDGKKAALKLLLLTQLFAIRDQRTVARGALKRAAMIATLFTKLLI